MTLLVGLVVQVVDLPPIAGDLVILDVAEVMSDIKLLGEGFTNIPADVIHSGRPCMIQPFFKPGRVSTKLTHAGTNKQVFQISGTLVTFVLVVQHGEVGHGNKFPCRLCFILMKQVIYAGRR